MTRRRRYWEGERELPLPADDEWVTDEPVLVGRRRYPVPPLPEFPTGRHYVRWLLWVTVLATCLALAALGVLVHIIAVDLPQSVVVTV